MTSTPDPTTPDPEMAGLTDSELADYIHHWADVRTRFQRQATDQRRQGRQPPRNEDTVNADTARPGVSAWWAGKILDRGLRERERRRQDPSSNHDGEHA